MRGLVVLFAVFAAVLVSAAEVRVWKSKDGKSKIEASYVSYDGLRVKLKTTNGRVIEVPSWKLCQADRDLIKDLSSGGGSAGDTGAAATPGGSARGLLPMPEYARPTGLPHPAGKVVGPIEAAPNAHYMLYLPTTLRAGRKAPLLFYTNAVGGKGRLIDELTPAAEINGWVLAVSIESRNQNDVNKNQESCKEAVEHILKTLPVDDDRLYFTGNSGGGAMSFYNYDNLDGYGLMPVVGYNPGVSTPRGDAFVINGAYDFNRYTSAAARADIGKSAVHRFYPKGHGGAPAWLRIDGMLWLEGQHLSRKGDREPEHREVYVVGMINYIEELRSSEPHRAYYWAKYLHDEIKLSSAHAARVDAVMRELGKDQNNTLYVQGLDDIDELSLRKMSKVSTGSKMRYRDDALASECRKLLKTYAGVPVIDGVLNAMMKETDALKGR